MKFILLILSLFSVSALWAQEDPAKAQPVKVADGYQVKIMTSAVCEMCKETIEKDLTFEKGVKEVNLDVETKILTVVYKPKKTDPLKLRTRVTEIGYNADDLNRDPEAYENLPFCCKDGAHDDDH